MKQWYWKLRHAFYTVSGKLRRLLGLSYRDSRTVGEIMSELEKDPHMRELLEDARRDLGIKRRHW